MTPSSSTPPLPPDRAHILTEQRNPRSAALYTLSVAECVTLIQREDRVISAAMERAAPAISAFIADAEAGFLAGGRLIYLGAGTSGRLGVLDASEAPPTFCIEPGRIVGLIAGGDSALRKSSEGMEDDPAGARAELSMLGLGANDAVLGIAAGGTTPYVLGGIAIARELGAGVTGLLACAPAPKPAAANHHIVIETGPEVLTGSTRMKAGTATKLALNTISTTLMIRAGRVYQNLMVDVRATNDKLRDRAARILCSLTGLSRLEALDLLGCAGDSVKTAAVMRRCSMTRAAAEASLRAAGGRLDRVPGFG